MKNLQQDGFNFESVNSSFFTADLSQEQTQKLMQDYVNGKSIEWDKLYPIRRPIKVPMYCFDKVVCWAQEFEDSIKPIQSIKSKMEVIEQPSNIHYLKYLWSNIPLNFKSSNVDLFWVHLNGSRDLNNQKSSLSDFLDRENKLLSNDKIQNIVLDLTSEDQVDLKSFSSSIYEFARIIQSLGRTIKIIILKCGTQSSIDPLFQATSSLFKTLSIESSKISVKTLRILEEVSDISLILQSEFSSFLKRYEDIRYTNKAREVKKLNVSENVTNSNRIYRENGVYVISGGLGKVGVAISQFLMGNYSATVHLIGSSLLNEEKTLALRSLQQSENGKVFYHQCDVLDSKQIKTLIDSIVETHTQINGVIHSAGILKDSLFISKSFEDFWSVVSVKLLGLINLDTATAALPLDFFVSYSSIASVYGNAGQADYCYANAFVDEYASLRNSFVKQGLRSGFSFSINWPLWSEGGMGISSEQAHFMKQEQGMEAISNREGYHIFGNLLQGVNLEERVIPIKGDLKKIIEFSSRLFDEKQAEEISTLSFKTTHENLTGELVSLVADVTKLNIDQIDMITQFGDMGFDSVSLQNLANKIKEVFLVEIPPSAFFTYNTIAKISSHLANKLPSESTFKPMEQKPLLEVVPTFPLIVPKINKYAIIGANGYLPGAISLDEFWHNMTNKNDVISSLSKRWKNRDYLGGLVPNMDLFDPVFFGMSAREAMLMDPQHRLFLQTAFNTFLDAGYDPLLARRVGVFAGIQFNDYQILLQQWKQSRHPYSATGNAHAMLANRVSYLFNFSGPSQTIDTACSSSLIALKRGVMALEHRECDFALIGAASLLIDHEVTDAAKSMGVLSARYRCATFDESADGYVRGEGVGCILLKRY
ncbi:MAG: type I polyketide synthase, partial [Flavobacteriales bacterium]|nr:type I polyketide synthase [Flavobacteriales bacterium]